MSAPQWTGIRRTRLCGQPPIFCTDDEAITWAVFQRAFVTATEAQTAYDAARTLYGRQVWTRWIGLVGKRVESLGRMK